MCAATRRTAVRPYPGRRHTLWRPNRRGAGVPQLGRDSARQAAVFFNEIPPPVFSVILPAEIENISLE
jgi:hypothetical protein